MRRTIATDLLLLAYDEKGDLVVDVTILDPVVAVACLVDLVEEGALALATDASAPVPIGHLYATGELRPASRSSTLATRAEGCTPKEVVSKIGLWSGYSVSDLRRALQDRLAAHGVVTREDRRALGFLRYDAWLPTDPTVGAAVKAEVRAALTESARPAEHTVTLVSLLGLLTITHRLFPDLDQAEVEARIQELQRSDWGSAALRSATEDADMEAIMVVLGVLAIGAFVAS
ncbi:GOLPH3/VPS74 family protein [Salana multivorans]